MKVILVTQQFTHLAFKSLRDKLGLFFGNGVVLDVPKEQWDRQSVRASVRGVQSNAQNPVRASMV